MMDQGGGGIITVYSYNMKWASSISDCELKRGLIKIGGGKLV